MFIRAPFLRVRFEKALFAATCIHELYSRHHTGIDRVTYPHNRNRSENGDRTYVNRQFFKTAYVAIVEHLGDDHLVSTAVDLMGYVGRRRPKVWGSGVRVFGPVSPPPSPRTCGFPASGAPEPVASGIHRSAMLVRHPSNQTEVMDVLVQVYACRGFVGALAASPKVSY